MCVQIKNIRVIPHISVLEATMIYHSTGNFDQKDICRLVHCTFFTLSDNGLGTRLAITFTLSVVSQLPDLKLFRVYVVPVLGTMRAEFPKSLKSFTKVEKLDNIYISTLYTWYLSIINHTSLIFRQACPCQPQHRGQNRDIITPTGNGKTNAYLKRANLCFIKLPLLHRDID